MAKVYLLNDSDFARLFAELERDPRIGGDYPPETERDRLVYESARRRFRYVIATWANEVKRDS